MVDMTDASMAGPSMWERDMHAHLTTHVENERALLQQYSAIADKTESKAFRYLVNLLIEDEIRHHRIFTELADSLKAEALLTGEDPVVPYLDFDRAESAVVLDATRRLTESEQEDARELKRLHRQLREVKDTTLWDVLVELMQYDTDKHIAMLRFVAQHTPRGR